MAISWFFGVEMKVKFIIRVVFILLFATIIHYLSTRQILEFILLLIIWNTWED